MLTSDGYVQCNELGSRRYNLTGTVELTVDFYSRSSVYEE